MNIGITASSDNFYDQYYFKGEKMDFYQIALLYEITDPCLQHALKKLLRGGRSHKDIHTDVRNAIDTLKRWEELHPNEAAKVSLDTAPFTGGIKEAIKVLNEGLTLAKAREALLEMLESVINYNAGADAAGYEIDETPARKALGMEDTRNSWEVRNAEAQKLWDESQRKKEPVQIRGASCLKCHGEQFLKIEGEDWKCANCGELSL